MDAVVTVLLAVASGLTFIAYKHPQAFNRLMTPLTLAYSVVGLLVITWNTSSGATFSAVKGSIPADKLVGAAQKADRLLLDDWLPFAVFIGSYIYLFFLNSFPLWLTRAGVEKDK